MVFNNRGIRICYRIARRQGYARGEPALQSTLAGDRRLKAAFAIIEASDWKADPLLVVKQGIQADSTLSG